MSHVGNPSNSEIVGAHKALSAFSAIPPNKVCCTDHFKSIDYRI